MSPEELETPLKRSFFQIYDVIWEILYPHFRIKMKYFTYILNKTHHFPYANPKKSIPKSFQLFCILPTNQELANIFEISNKTEVSRAGRELAKSNAIIIQKDWHPKRYACINPAFYIVPPFIGLKVLENENEKANQ